MSRPAPANYTANVNRAKTKKWVEAKSYSYDGDDWGDVDDYDEYGGYNEPEPQPVPKPTGLRQRGQSAIKVPQDSYDARQDLYQSPVDVRQPQNSMSNSAPQQQPDQQYEVMPFSSPKSNVSPMVTRQKSFDGSDEHRDFSAGSPQRFGFMENRSEPLSQRQDTASHEFQLPQQPRSHPNEPVPAAAAAAPSYVPRKSVEDQARYGGQARSPSGGYQDISSSDQVRQFGMGSRTQSMTSNVSGMDFHNRRDFSPSAMPLPLQTRPSPSPHNSDIYSSSRPPRKSSLGQDSPSTQLPEEALPTSNMNGQEEKTSSTRDRVNSGSGKTLAFVRPAEIYKRMQAEKEKERQSQDSSRPSMDTIIGAPSDRPSLSRSQDSESSQRLNPNLDPVRERKSEYGIEGVNLQDPEPPSEPQSTSSKTFEFPKRESKTVSHAPKSSLGPMLPDVSRVSGFGESFFGHTGKAGGSFQDSMLDFAGSSLAEPALESDRREPEKSLEHQSSLGFTSAVHQAFDKAEDQVPPTPSSTQGSSVVRSTSGGTSVVSPIISRGPSTATEQWNSRLPAIDDVATPIMPEGLEGSSAPPVSSNSQSTPTGIQKEIAPSRDSLPHEIQEPPPSFIPGYRRSSDTPSPDNSPRRTPILETNRQLRQPQEIEFAAVTPTELSSSTGDSSQASEVSPEEHLRREQPIDEVSNPIRGSNTNIQVAPEKSTRSFDTPISPISPITSSQDRLQRRADSSNSSRVRNLADKFESNSRPGSSHSTATPRASVIGSSGRREDDFVPPRPVTDRMESFRPHLPGGWESSISIAPAATSNAAKASEDQPRLDPSESTTTPFSHLSTAEKNTGQVKGTPVSNSTVGQIKDASEEAFAAVAAAGSALAGAFGSAVGMEHQGDSLRHADETPSDQANDSHKHDVNESAISTERTLHPEASKPHIPALSDNEMSTAATTPIPQVFPLDSRAKSSKPEYFPSSSTDKDIESPTKLNNEARPAKHQPVLPLLATDTQHQQYESDRLRKEIVRELTPMSKSEPTTAETDSSNYQMTLSTTNQSARHPGHESGVLPREYESYWNEAASDDETDDLDRGSAPSKGSTSVGHRKSESAVVKPLQPNSGNGSTVPLAVTREELSQRTSPMLPHRFSWEEPLQDLSPDSEPAHRPHKLPKVPSSNSLQSAKYPVGKFPTQEEPFEHERAAPLPTEPADVVSGEISGRPEQGVSTTVKHDTLDPDSKLVRQDMETQNYSGGPEVVSSGSAEQASELPIGEREQHGKDRDGPGMMTYGNPLCESEPPPTRPHGSTSLDISRHYVDVPQDPPSSTSQSRIPAFREILALKLPSERIQAYNETREQFAHLNTGLSYWLAATMNDFPEHVDLLENASLSSANVQGHRPSPSRSKLGSLLPTGGHSGQQSHSQQTSHPSIQSPVASSATQSPGLSGGPSPGFAPSGGTSGKLSSQQVQAKGKDLLHTAGVFGGKANVAAKGLFSKGKSKLRAASGNEKAFPRQTFDAESSPHGVHQPQINVPARRISEVRIDVQTDKSEIAVRSPSPGHLYPSQSSQSASSRDTPSVESFSRSQLGDDEYSEESETNKRDHRQRASIQNSKQDLFTSHQHNTPTKTSAHVRAGKPATIEDQRGASIDIGPPYRLSTLDGSNRTPTQASFAGRGQMTQGTMPSDNDALRMGSPQKQSSADSKDTIRNVMGDRELGRSSPITQSPTSLQGPEYNHSSRTPVRMSAPAASAVSPMKGDFQKSRSAQPKSRPSSSNRDSLSVLRPSEDRSFRGPSIDGLPSRMDFDRPPSPVSPYLATLQEGAAGRRGPNDAINHRPEYDLVPNGDHERRNRSRSYPKARPSQDTYRTSIHDKPALGSSGERTPQSHPRRPSRDHSPILKQQAPEYEIEGARSTIEWPSENRSRSRRSSRSSTFFASLALKNSPKEDEPPLPNTQGHDTVPLPINPQTPEKKKNKRTSIFGSLARDSGNESAGPQSQENVKPSASTSFPTQLVSSTFRAPPPPPPPQPEDDEFPSRGNSRSATSKLPRRLQRSSTAGHTEQSSGKKKRFSGFGSLFGRGSPRNHNSSAQVPVCLSNEISSLQPRQHDFNVTNLPVNQQNDWYKPPKDIYTPPPPGGYYAPRPAQAFNESLPYNPAFPRNGSNALDPNTPAYVQDATLRQPVDQQVSLSAQAQSSTPLHQSAAFPLASPQSPMANAAPSSTVRSSSRGQTAQHSAQGEKPFGSSWTRFSQHGRSKSRQESYRTASATPERNLPTQPIIHPPLPRTVVSQEYRQSHSYPNPSRSDSPPPPPPPPKDTWNQPSHGETSSRVSTPRLSKHAQTPSQTRVRTVSGHSRQSLPPLQTDVQSKHESGATSVKALSPEEKRKSRQQEIENSTLTPKSPVKSSIRTVPNHTQEEEDEPVVMSATSFPGQEWQPEYAHWNGD